MLSWREPGKGVAGEATPYTALMYTHPARASRSSPALGGGSAGDSPGKAGPGKQLWLYPSPASPYTPDRGEITRGGAGEETPSPSRRAILALPKVPRAGAGALVVRSRRGRGRRGDLDCAFRRFVHRSPLPHSTRAFDAPPLPLWGGSAGDSPGKAGPILSFAGIPHTPDRGAIARGWGPLRKTLPALSQCPRAGERGFS